MTPMQPSIVLDKSYLQRATRAHVHELGASHRLLMSEALLYELLSKSADYRRCFSKLPMVDNPVDIVWHVGGYLKREIEGHRRSPRPSEAKRDIDFRFNSRLLDEDYVLPPGAADELERQRLDLVSDIGTFKERALGMPSFFADAFIGSDGARQAARTNAEALIASAGSLLDFYEQLRAPKGIRRYPPRKLIDDSWAIYRWLQVQFLFALDLYARYGERLREPMSESTHEKVEHDVLDAQYLLVGVLEGAFATEERKLQRWFSLLRPDGLLLHARTDLGTRETSRPSPATDLTYGG